MKGGAEIVVRHCDTLLGSNGNPEELSDEKKDEIEERVIKKFASKTFRTLGVSYCDYSEADWESLKA